MRHSAGRLSCTISHGSSCLEGGYCDQTPASPKIVMAWDLDHLKNFLSCNVLVHLSIKCAQKDQISHPV